MQVVNFIVDISFNMGVYGKVEELVEVSDESKLVGSSYSAYMPFVDVVENVKVLA